MQTQKQMKQIYTKLLNKCSAKFRLPGIMLLLILILNEANGQYFSQNFDTSSTLSYYFNASNPSTAQFNASSVSTGTAMSIANQKLRFVRSNNGAGAATRTTDFIGSPNFIIMTFDMTVSGSHSSGTDLGRIAIGYDFTANTSNENSTSGGSGRTFAYLHIEARGSNGYRIETADDDSPDQSSGSTISVTWVLNNSGATQTYAQPSGGTTTIGNDEVDCWIGTSRFSNSSDVSKTSAALEDLKITVYGGTSTTIDFDNFNISGLPPAVTTQPSNQTVCLGASASFSSAASGSPTLQWEKQISGVWTPISGQTTSPLVINPTTVPDIGNYRAVFTNSSGSTTSNVVSLNLDVPSDGGAVTPDVTVCYGTNSGTLNLNGETGTPTNWQYSTNSGGNWTNITNTTTSQTFSNLTATRWYRAVVANGTCPSANSTHAVVTVQPGLAQFSLTGATSYCSGGTGSVIGLSGSELNVDYQLKLNGGNVGSPVSGTGSAISFGAQTAAGNYTVEGTNTSTSCTELIGATLSLSITANPVVNSVSAIPGSICAGANSVLASSGSSPIFTQPSFTNSTSGTITDNSTTGISRTVTVSGLPSDLSQVQNLRITINLSHNNDFHLEAYLIRPGGSLISSSSGSRSKTIVAGQSICLVDSRGGSGNNFTNTVFSDAAATAIGSGSSPFTGTFNPEDALSTLTGDPNGVWTFLVLDNVSGSTGSYSSWTLTVDLYNGVSYSWTSNPAGFTSSVQNPGSVSPTVNTDYIVQITDDGTGCTASSTASVTVNPVTSNTTTISACDSYFWAQNGQTYTASGTYTDVVGCHTEELVLTITASTLNSTTISACDSYFWAQNGQTYTASGTYTDVVGCHTEELILTVTPTTSNSSNVSACDSYFWAQNGQTYTVSGTYTDVVGCHTEEIVLTITTSTLNSTTVSVCDSYFWAQNGQTYTTSGTYTDVVGCHT